MALSGEEKRKIRKYFGVAATTSVGLALGEFLATGDVAEHKLEVALSHLTADGETTARELLADLDALWPKLRTLEVRFQAVKVGSIELRRDELDERIRQFRFYLARLDATLFPEGMGLLTGSALAIQGPNQEP